MTPDGFTEFERRFEKYVLQLFPELGEMECLGCTKGSFYGNESDWTKGGHSITRDGCF
jgi:hypothetical protein